MGEASPGVQGPERILVEEWRLGGPDAKEPAAFSSEPLVVVGRDGSLYTRGERDSEIRVFDARGRFLRTIGHRGRGPGEFEVIAGHGFVGDTLWVSNTRNLAISTFTTSGQHIATRRVAVDLAERFAWPIGITAFLKDGKALTVPSGAPIGANGRLQVPVLLGDREMRSRDTLLHVTRPEQLYVPGVGTFWWVPIVRPPVLCLAPDGSGLVVINWNRDSDSVQVRRIHSDASIRWRRTLTLPTLAIGETLRDSLVDRATRMAAGQIDAARRRGRISSAVSTRSLLLESLDLPRRYPPVQAAVLGSDGTVWLHHGGPGPTQRWVVLDSLGGSLFEVVSSIRLTIQAASRDAVWATMSDADGFPYLIRYGVRVRQ